MVGAPKPGGGTIVVLYALVANPLAENTVTITNLRCRRISPTVLPAAVINRDYLSIVMERDTLSAPRGQWKKRLGWGGRNKGKPMVVLKADGHTTNNNNNNISSNNSVPPDDGDARTLRRQAKKNSFFRRSFRRNNNNNNTLSSSQTVDTESRDDGPQRTPNNSAPPHRSVSKVNIACCGEVPCLSTSIHAHQKSNPTTDHGGRKKVGRTFLLHLVSTKRKSSNIQHGKTPTTTQGTGWILS